MRILDSGAPSFIRAGGGVIMPPAPLLRTQGGSFILADEVAARGAERFAEFKLVTV